MTRRMVGGFVLCSFVLWLAVCALAPFPIDSQPLGPIELTRGGEMCAVAVMALLIGWAWSSPDDEQGDSA